jgi:hypothetical protein
MAPNKLYPEIGTKQASHDYKNRPYSLMNKDSPRVEYKNE